MMKSLRSSALLFTLFAVLMALTSETARSQGNCIPNMLSISAPGSYVATPSTTSLRLSNGFTIECWAKANSSTRLAGILDKGNALTTFYGLMIDTSSVVVGRARTSTNVRVISPSLDLSLWHHYALVFSPGDSFYLYVDGQEAGSQKTSATQISFSSDSLLVGLSRSGTGFQGSIDELRIWNVARTQASIASTMQHTLLGTEAGLVLYYPFDDLVNSIRIHDYSNHGNDGFIQGRDANIVASNSPVTGTAVGWRIDALEKQILIPTKRCSPSFDTLIHVRNLGSEGLQANSVGFYRGQVFSITSDLPLTLRPDSTKYETINIHFSPNAGGVFYDTLLISSSDVCAGALRIGVQATYDSVGIAVDPAVLKFGNPTQCELPETRSVTLKNLSSTDSVTIASVNTPPGILFSSPLPIHLVPNASVSVILTIKDSLPGFSDVTLDMLLNKCTREGTLEITGTRQLAQFSLPPSIVFPSVTASLDGITLDTVILLRNSGDVAMSIRSVKGDSIFHVVDDKIGTFLPAGDTVSIPLHAYLTQCGHYVTHVRAIGAVCAADTSSTVSIDVLPPGALQAPNIDMGLVCLLADTTIVIRNPNPQPIRLDTVTFSKDQIFFTPYGSFPRIIPAGDTIQLPLRFAPGVNGDYVTTGYLHSTPCGLAPVSLSGTKGLDGLSFEANTISFGRGCDTSGLLRIVLLRNTSVRPIDIASLTILGSKRYTLSVSRVGLLPPGDSIPVTIKYAPRLNSIDTASLIITSIEGCTSVPLMIRSSREFAKANWKESIGEFDTVCPGTSSDKIFSLHNSGIDSIDVTLASSNPSFTVVSGPRSIGPGKEGMFTVRYASSLTGERLARLQATLDACGSTATLPLHATGGPAPFISTSESLLDFGRVKVGTFASVSIDLQNPSCTPLIIDRQSVNILTSEFTLDSASNAKLPISISNSKTVRLTFLYRPVTYGRDSSIAIILVNALADTITLVGTGLAPDLKVTESLLDFGFVLHGQAKSIYAHLKNFGNDTAFIASHNSGTPDYSASTLKFVAPADTASLLVSFQPRLATGLLYGMLFIDWGEHTDTVTLRGQGTDNGLLISSLGVDFGDVHIHHDSLSTLYLTATSDFPTIASARIIGTSASKFGFAPLSHTTIAGPSDTIPVVIKYSPDLEVADAATLELTDQNGKITTIPLTGHGVEAHLVVNPISIDFGPVILGQSFPVQSIRLSDTGGYHANILSTVTGPNFVVTNTSGSGLLRPHDTLNYQVTFQPQRARFILDTLFFVTDTPAIAPFVVLSGTGTYPAGQNAEVGYRIGSVQVKSGDLVNIPVEMHGNNFYHLDADSIVLDIALDPTMVRIRGVHGVSGKATNLRFARIKDSIIEIAFPYSAIDTGHIFDLEAEALLGSTPISQISVLHATPPVSITPAATDGLFTVTDCGQSGAIHGVTFAGDYQLKNAAPNPASDRTVIAYTLGISGPVSLTIYNAIGTKIETISEEQQPAGNHSISFDASALPNGRYVYCLESLEYRNFGALIVLH